MKTACYYGVRVGLILMGLLYITALWVMHRRLDSYSPEEINTNWHQTRYQRVEPELERVAKSNDQPQQNVQETTRQEPRAELQPQPEAVTSVEWSKKSTFVIPPPEYAINPSDIWEEDRRLPSWIKDYFRWHKHQRSTSLSEEKSRLLIVSCLPDYRKCGGLADRLMTLPFLIRLAAETHRVLLFEWGKPAPLEEFLLPPVGGLDWRKPQHINPAGDRAGVQDVILDLAHNASIPTLRIKFQAHDHGEDFYDKSLLPDEPPFQQVFSSCWKVCFTPVPALASMIQQYLLDNRLEPHRYASSHLRALYNVKERDPAFVTFLAQGAINCTSHFLPHRDADVFFASDSKLATEEAIKYGGHQGVRVVSPAQRTEDPLHLDKAKKWKSRRPEEFYDAFVDLYVLSLGNCVTYGMGGYGKMGSYMSTNVSCAYQHMKANSLGEWMFNTKLQPKPVNNRPPLKSLDNLFIPHMSPGLGELQATAMRAMSNSDEQPFPNLRAPPEPRIWQKSNRLPQWMKDYFDWHHDRRIVLNLSNYEKERFLVVVCLETDDKCGGTADRLRPIPALVRIAADSKRILLIHWERPLPLTEFLVPPIGGVDWRVPKWFEPILSENVDRIYTIERLVNYAPSDRSVVMARVQVSDHGWKYYNTEAQAKGELEDALREHYRDCWFSLFTPSPAIAQAVEKELQDSSLSPYEFSFVHLRAQYGIEQRGREPEKVRDWTINSINCISSLRPGGPFYFASDSAYARKVAVEYGQSKNATVVARLTTKDPLHLDFPAPKGATFEDYAEVFIDLYIMSLGVCMSYNVGGYGKWGLLLSGRHFKCNIRHWTAGVPKATADKLGCAWHGKHERGDVKLVRRLETPLFLPPMD